MTYSGSLFEMSLSCHHFQDTSSGYDMKSCFGNMLFSRAPPLHHLPASVVFNVFALLVLKIFSCPKFIFNQFNYNWPRNCSLFALDVSVF